MVATTELRIAKRAIKFKAGGSRDFFGALLAGRKLTIIDTVMEFNLMTPNARAAELRKLGWPVRTMNVLHPRLAGQVLTAYFFDSHFLAWLYNEPGEINPKLYKGQEGRGKFHGTTDQAETPSAGSPTGPDAPYPGSASEGAAETVRRSGGPGTGDTHPPAPGSTSGEAQV